MRSLSGEGRSRYLVYGPPKSGKTLVSLFLASRSSSSGKVVFMDFEMRRQLITLGFIRIEPKVERFQEEVMRAAKIAKPLEASLVVDSLVPLIEFYGRQKVLDFFSNFNPNVDVYCTSLWYLPLHYRNVKVVRNGDRVMAIGHGIFMEAEISEIVRNLGGVKVGVAGRIQAT